MSLFRKNRIERRKGPIKTISSIHQTKGFGVIVRTVARKQKIAELDRSTNIDRPLVCHVKDTNSSSSLKVLGELNKASSIF